MSAVEAPAVALPPCGNCGSDEVRMRARGSSGSRRTAQVVCARCSARGELHVGADAEERACRAWTHRPVYMPVPTAVRVVQNRVPVPEPTLERDPLELIARMLVGGSFREPSDGRSTMPPLTAAADTMATIGAKHEKDRAAAEAVPAAVVAELRAGTVRLRHDLATCHTGRLTSGALSTWHETRASSPVCTAP
ncbi:hypothetical protein [Stenotrophomonas sp. JAI102]|uniref:hypothetical protein n=1 Tax=Stenotrophomonas sp. JAI102 TaxID=2723077 RepID=UPI0015CC7041|nr:hypothetical protein [Stenotrophomonas sp. JAI102]NYF36325.1 hypothetical protein [Stenotrophomonas sp. JAI102]